MLKYVLTYDSKENCVLKILEECIKIAIGDISLNADEYMFLILLHNGLRMMHRCNP